MIQKIEISDHIANYIKSCFGEDFFSKYYEYYKSPAGILYIRFSSLAGDPEILENDLTKYGIRLKKIENINGAYSVLSGEDKIGKTLEYSFGRYYIQSLSSMIPPLVLNPKPGERVLDLCAAPGSKSTQLAEMMKNSGTLIVNEPSNGRIKSLVFNIDKMNFTNTGIILGKGELLNPYFNEWFDKILVDAPCSALGIMHKKGEVNNWWTERHITGLSDLQLKLLIAGIKMLKPGGELVYSTCTLSIEENEAVINKAINKYPVELMDISLPVKSSNAFKRTEGVEFDESISKTRRIIPWEINSEGFFVAKLRKTDSTGYPKKNSDKRAELRFTKPGDNKISGYLDILGGWFGIERNILNRYKYIIRNNDVYFINGDWEYSGKDIFLRAGSKFGSVDKRDFIRLHTLAAQILNEHITKNNVVLQDEDQLNIYLSGGIIKSDFGEFGQKAVVYKGSVIGMAVNTKEGLKSQYPRAFRTMQVIFE